MTNLKVEIYRQGKTIHPQSRLVLLLRRDGKRVTVKGVELVPGSSSRCRKYKGAQTSHILIRNFDDQFFRTDLQLEGA